MRTPDGREAPKARWTDGRAKDLAEAVLSAVSAPVGSLYRVRTDEPLAALTFDDGPDPGSTPELLNILKRHDARATFFLIGRAVRRHPELVRRLVEEGHAVANHTWGHPSLPLLSSTARHEEVARCRRALDEIAGPAATRFFRPPYGHQSLASYRDVRRTGHQVVAWSGAGEDWAGDDARAILDRLRRRLRPGAILLLHDTLADAVEPAHRDRGPTLAAVDRLLSETAGEVRFRTLPELLAVGSPRFRPWFRPADREHLARLGRTEDR